jgi:hypothetical protein
MKIATLTMISCLLLVACRTDRTTSLENRHTEPIPAQREGDLFQADTFPSKWNTAETIGGPGFRVFRCEFPVPSAPAYTGQSIYLWCGVQQDSGIGEDRDTSFGVLQPVLMFGPDCVQDLLEGRDFGPDNDPTYTQSPYWYYSAQYIYPDPVGVTPKKYKCTTGRLFKANPGEILVSTMVYDFARDTMAVKIATRSGSNMSSLTVAHPWNNPRRTWRGFMGKNRQIVLEGALEIPEPDPTSPMPPEILQGWRLKAVVTPSSRLPFTGNEWQLVPNPQNTLAVKCGYDAAIRGSDCTWSRK